MKSIFLALLILSFALPLSAKDRDCITESLRQLLADPSFKEIDAKDVPAEASKIISKGSGLSEERVNAIRDNFANVPVTDGSTGVFKFEGKTYVNSNVNLVKAYKDANENVKVGALSVDDLTKIRGNAMELFSIDNNRLVSPKVVYKAPGSSATVKGSIDAAVAKRMQDFGIKVEEINGATKITYPENPEKALGQSLAEINKMMKSYASPEAIVAKAVQDILIIHPFKDGNGRTARLLGQVLYEKLTGKTVVFPAEFHKELNFSADALAKALETGGSVREQAAVPVYAQVRKFLENEAGANFKARDLPNKVLPTHKPGDLPFVPEFKNGDKTVRYDSLPIAERRFDDIVYYARPLKSPVEMRKNAGLIFQFGRNSRGNPHFDVEQHIDGTFTDPSGFFPTTPSLKVAKEFGQFNGSRAPSVVYVIDPRGAEVLNLNRFAKKQGVDHEAEIVFSQKLPAERIIGAVYYPTGYRTAKDAAEFYPNPNYVAPNP